MQQMDRDHPDNAAQTDSPFSKAELSGTRLNTGFLALQLGKAVTDLGFIDDDAQGSRTTDCAFDHPLLVIAWLAIKGNVGGVPKEGRGILDSLPVGRLRNVDATSVSDEFDLLVKSDILFCCSARHSVGRGDPGQEKIGEKFCASFHFGVHPGAKKTFNAHLDRANHAQKDSPLLLVGIVRNKTSIKQ